MGRAPTKSAIFSLLADGRPKSHREIVGAPGSTGPPFSSTFNLSNGVQPTASPWVDVMSLESSLRETANAER